MPHLTAKKHVKIRIFFYIPRFLYRLFYTDTFFYAEIFYADFFTPRFFPSFFISTFVTPIFFTSTLFIPTFFTDKVFPTRTKRKLKLENHQSMSLGFFLFMNFILEKKAHGQNHGNLKTLHLQHKTIY